MNTDPFAFDHLIPPVGWAGTDAKQHTYRGPFRLVVSRVFQIPDPRYFWSLSVGDAVIANDRLGYPDAATARAAVLARLAEIAGEVDEVPVALGVAELPDAANTDDERAVIALVDGRPTPATAYVSAGRVRVHGAHTAVSIGLDTPVYPESAAPALWRAFLRGRS